WSRERGGPGRFVDISLTASALSLAALSWSSFQATGRIPPRGRSILSGGLAAYQIYPTKDGKFIALGALEEKFWTQVCRLTGKTHLLKSGLSLGKDGEAAIAELKGYFLSENLS